MSNWEAIAKESEEVLARPDIKGCHEILMKAYEAGERHPEILWRLGRSHYEMAEESTDSDVRRPHLLQGLELCQQSVKEDGNNFASHKWLGILLSAQDVGNKEKIANAYTIKEHFLKAVELNPKDATSLHCMGNWCYSVLKIGWLERKAAAMLFGEPPSSTTEECLKYLLASAEAGDTIHNATMIGDVYKMDGNKAEARKWYQKAIDMPTSSELQKRNHDKAVEGSQVF
ncbi:regulator of microtubule dynamics protein 1 [Angomonas deanei]|nr:regulator of microtubule dynamics protein 1 [Angomonas deanei]|eukprot:EPY43546.1 regulator of microtubule dynamics protein 1 [Angomonas deanei]